MNGWCLRVMVKFFSDSEQLTPTTTPYLLSTKWFLAIYQPSLNKWNFVTQHLSAPSFCSFSYIPQIWEIVSWNSNENLSDVTLQKNQSGKVVEPLWVISSDKPHRREDRNDEPTNPQTYPQTSILCPFLCFDWLLPFLCLPKSFLILIKWLLKFLQR